MLKSRQRLGKYRIEKRLGEGGFAVVYQAMDTIEGVRVALKIPHHHHVSEDVLNSFRHEVRVAAKLQHPNILPIKNADFIGDHFVIASPLAECTLADRLKKRISFPVAIDYSEQMVEAVAAAHEHRIIHCDIKPENFMLFADHELRLADFGIAKISMRTLWASGSGTIGYVAPEQAMGRPSFRSDVFSLGLILARLYSGTLPEYPFDWPPKGHARMRRSLHPDMRALIQRAIDLNPRRRFRDGLQLRNEFARVKRRSIRYWSERKS